MNIARVGGVSPLRQGLIEVEVPEDAVVDHGFVSWTDEQGKDIHAKHDDRSSTGAYVFDEESAAIFDKEMGLEDDFDWNNIYTRQQFQESRFKSDAVSPDGATSIAQIMPDTFADGLKKGYVPEGTKYEDLATDDALAIQFQKSYMEDLMSRSWNKGTEEVKIAKALAAYNMGPTGLVNYLTEQKAAGVDIYNSLDWIEGLNKETKNYVSNILTGGDVEYEAEFEKEHTRYLGEQESSPIDKKIYMKKTESPLYVKGGVGSPIKILLEDTPVGSSALRQVEDEVKTAKQNIQDILGGVGGLAGNLKGGVENFLGALGFKPREDGKSGLGLSEKEKKEAKRIGVSEYQWATNSAGNAITSSNIRRSKKKIGALGDEITEYDIFADEIVTSKWDPEAKEGKGAYVRIDDEITEGDKEIVDEQTGETIVKEKEGESVDGGVTNPNSLENLKTENKTNVDIGGFGKEDKMAIQKEMINSGADLSYTVDNKKVEGLDAADGNWGPRSQQAYQWYLDGNDLKDFVYKPVKKSETKIETPPTDYATVKNIIATLTDKEYDTLGGGDYRGDDYWDTQVFTNLYGFDYYLYTPSYHTPDLEDMGLPANYSTPEGETITLKTNSGTYTGGMKDGKFHGQGTFVWAKDNSNYGNQISGNWKKNKFYEVTLTTKKGLNITYNAQGDDFFDINQLKGTT